MGDNRTLDFPDDPGIRYVAKEVFQEHCYAPIGTMKPNVVLDIGANVGIAAAYFRTVYPKARIVCVEPDPIAFAHLRKIAHQLGDCWITQAALGAENRTGKFYLGTSSVLSSVTNALSDRHIDVDFMAADEFYDGMVVQADVMKIDTEGSERVILQSLGERATKVPLVHIEFHSEADRRMIDDMFAQTHHLWRAKVSSPHRGLLTYVAKATAPEMPEPELRYNGVQDLEV